MRKIFRNLDEDNCFLPEVNLSDTKYNGTYSRALSVHSLQQLLPT